VAESIVAQKSYQFALRIIKLCQFLRIQKKEHVLSRQLLRSGTSIGANIEEAVAAQSKADFINKLAIALKETRETSYWLRLLKDAAILSQTGFESIHSDCIELKKMLSSIILSSKKNNS